MTKKLIFLSLAFLSIAFVSCKKCADCVCENDITYTYGPNVSEDSKQQIESGTTPVLNERYPEVSEEICARGGNFDDDKKDFEDDSETETFENQGSTKYSYEFNHTCTCTDQ